MKRMYLCPINSGRRKRGSALSMMIVVSVVITGLIMTLAAGAGVQASSASTRTQSDEALYAAEGALQWAIYQLRQNPSWRPSGVTPVVGGWTSTITYTDLGTPTGAAGNPLEFTVITTKAGSNSRGKVTATVKGALANVPQFWSVGDLSVAQSVTLSGGVETMGKMTVKAPTSGAVKKATGTFKAKGAVIDLNPAGSGAYFTTYPTAYALDLTPTNTTALALYNSLKAKPTANFWDCYANGVIDFRKAGGKPILYSGPGDGFASITVINSANAANDTLLVEATDGTVNFSGALTSKMNMVVKGNVLFNGTVGAGIQVEGSFYVSGSWTQQGMYKFKGTVMADQMTTLAGTGTVDVQAPPSFDPRYVPRITSYTGNLP